MNINKGSIKVTGSNFEQAPGSAIPAKAVLLGVSDGTNIRAMTGNTTATLLASAARTATSYTPTQTNYNARGVIIVLDITVASGTGGISIQFGYRSPITGNIKTVGSATTPKTTTGTVTLMVYPGIAVGGDVNLNTALPSSWLVAVSHADGSSYTYSVSALLII